MSLVSNCCDAPIEGEILEEECAVCSACKEWCAVIDEEED